MLLTHIVRSIDISSVEKHKQRLTKFLIRFLSLRGSGLPSVGLIS